MIPAFLSEIATLQVFLGGACSCIGRLKSCVDTFGTYVMIATFWAVLWTHQECQVYIPGMFFHLNKRVWVLWSWAPQLGKSLHSPLSDIARTALWDLLTVLFHCSPVQERYLLLPCAGGGRLPCRAAQSPSSSTARQGVWNELCAVHVAGLFLVLSNLGWRVLLLKTSFLLHIVKIKTSLQPPS